MYELIDSLQILREKCLETGKLAAETETSAAPTNATGVQVGADGSQTSIGFGEPSSMFAQDGFDKPTFNTLTRASSLTLRGSGTMRSGILAKFFPDNGNKILVLCGYGTQLNAYVVTINDNSMTLGSATSISNKDVRIN